jgi:hypothetical protein
MPVLAGVAANRLGDLGQRRLRLTKDRDLGRVVLAELPRVHVEVHDRQSRWHRIDVVGQREREEIAADREEEVIGCSLDR